MSRLSQQNSYATNTIEKILNKELILALLETIDVGTIHSINIIQKVSHSPINESIIIEIPNDGCVGENPILIALSKANQPSTRFTMLSIKTERIAKIEL